MRKKPGEKVIKWMQGGIWTLDLLPTATAQILKQNHCGLDKFNLFVTIQRHDPDWAITDAWHAACWNEMITLSCYTFKNVINMWWRYYLSDHNYHFPKAQKSFGQYRIPYLPFKRCVPHYLIFMLMIWSFSWLCMRKVSLAATSLQYYTRERGLSDLSNGHLHL